MKVCVCRFCSKEFRPKKPDRTTYCSRECSYAARTAVRQARLKEQLSWKVPRPCIDCGVLFLPRSPGHVRCKKKTHGDKKHRVCIQCFKSFVAMGNERTCSEACRSERHILQIKAFRQTPEGKAYIRADRAVRRRVYGHKHRDRARYHGVPYETVNVSAVFERDQWRCQVCGVRTPKRLRGTSKPNAPELDHRIPMALGGPHSYDNVQCACKSCNQAKGGHTIKGQIPLFSMTYPGGIPEKMIEGVA